MGEPPDAKSIGPPIADQTFNYRAVATEAANPKSGAAAPQTHPATAARAGGSTYAITATTQAIGAPRGTPPAAAQARYSTPRGAAAGGPNPTHPATSHSPAGP
jgi:hypothetical protein